VHEVDVIAMLADPMRRDLYEYVAGAGHEVGRAEAADAVGMARTLAAFHLDKLVDAGLLEVARRRLTGRSGPGAGRPAKVYRVAASEHLASVPPRDYRGLAMLLAEAVEAAGAEEALTAAARRLPADLREPLVVLTERGYQPYRDGAVIRSRNCPFQALSGQFPVLVCAMNHALIETLLGAGGARVRLDPLPGECCVVVEDSKN
jgi:predicted ArsR family transcriptional regulator